MVQAANASLISVTVTGRRLHPFVLGVANDSVQVISQPDRALVISTSAMKYSVSVGLTICHPNSVQVDG